MAYAIFDTPATHRIPGIKELAQAGSAMVLPLVIATARLLQVLDDSTTAPAFACTRKPASRSVGTRERIGRHHDRWRDVTLIERRSAIRQAQAAAPRAGPGGVRLVEPLKRMLDGIGGQAGPWSRTSTASSLRP